MGPDGDAHVYQPTPADAKAVAAAQIVFINGLGFEGWMDRLIKSASFQGPVVVASKGIKPLTMAEEDGHEDDHDAHGKTEKGHHDGGDAGERAARLAHR